MLTTDIAWAAGLLEGEGCFYIGTNRHGLSVQVVCCMTDKDVIERLAKVFGVGKVGGPYKNRSAAKHHWKWCVASREGVREVMRLVLPYMGLRRAAKIAEITARMDAWVPKKVGRPMLYKNTPQPIDKPELKAQDLV